jgi:hypothetical protein
MGVHTLTAGFDACRWLSLFICEVSMIYDAFVWFSLVFALVQWAAGDGAAGAVAFLLILIQIGRALRNRRHLAY